MPIDRLVEQIDLFISGQNLAQVQAFNIPDAFAVVYRQNLQTHALTKLSSTEIIRDNKSPQWITILSLDYEFESIQQMVIKVFQEDGGKPTSDESQHTLIGETTFRLSEIMLSQYQTKSLSINHPSRGDQGAIQVRCESKVNTRDLLCVTFSCQKLLNKEGFFNISDPYLVISRKNEDNSWSPVWKGDHIDNDLNPKWTPIKIPMGLLCNGDRERPLRIEVFDHNENTADVSMGCVETTVNAMVESNGAPFPVIEAARVGKAAYRDSGTLTCSDCSVEEVSDEKRPITFSEFVFTGGEISLIVGIDFTASNGHADKATSLHYIDPTGEKKNQYEQAILSVGNIVEAYDTDKKYPVYGFGAAKNAKVAGEASKTLHCFPLDEANVEVDGVAGMLNAYKSILKELRFSGPTNFAPLIKKATQTASRDLNSSPEHRKHTILLILTDGEITDLQDTKAAIIEV